MLRIKIRFQVVIGISTFYAFMGLILNKIGFVDNAIYHCIDYYPSRSFLTSIFRKMDKYLVERSRVTWDLSQSITLARRRSTRKMKNSVCLHVPLTYSSKLLTFRPLHEIGRWSIAFVGTLEKLQGVQLLVEAMPDILRELPKVTVRVVGDGPFAVELRRLVSRAKLDDHFVFYGFVEDDAKVVDIISRCAIGVALFVPVPENNAMTADPGKPKFYTFMGLPVVTTKIPSGLLLEREGAGLAIKYDPHECAQAVIKLLRDDGTLTLYRRKANTFAARYTSDRILPEVVSSSLSTLSASTRRNAS
jgi:glycosyltransferase involved in cell wall biosynthesis